MLFQVLSLLLGVINISFNEGASTADVVTSPYVHVALPSSRSFIRLSFIIRVVSFMAALKHNPLININHKTKNRSVRR